MPKPTRKAVIGKKPSADFPLFAHQRGYWAKKVKGQTRYFGKVADDPEGQKAFSLWLAQRNDVIAGRSQRRLQRPTPHTPGQSEQAPP